MWENWRRHQSDQNTHEAWKEINDLVMEMAKKFLMKNKRDRKKWQSQETRKKKDEYDEQRTILKKNRKYPWLESMSEKVKSMFNQWKQLIKIKRARKAYQKGKRSDRRKRQAKLAEEMQIAQDQNDLKEVHALSRLVTGKVLGLKGRRMNTPMQQRPTAMEWDRHLAQSGPDGGWQATRVEGQETTPDPRPRTDMPRQASHKRYKPGRILRLLRKMKPGKTVPDWSVPKEVGGILFNATQNKHMKAL